MKRSDDETPEDASAGPQMERGRAPAQARLARILGRLNEGGSVTVAELAREFGVSDMTVRRDLAELEGEGRLERVHGGAVGLSRGPLTLIDDVEPAFAARSRQNAEAKARIAAAAARMVAGRRVVAFDLGTTVLAALRAIIQDGPDPEFRAFTNSLRVAQLSASAGISTHVCGGQIRPAEMSLTGQDAVASFSRFYFDVALISASGLTPEGMFDYLPEEVAVKSVLLQRSSERILLLDSSKFRRVSTVRLAALSEITVLITDAPPPQELGSALDEAGVRVVIG
ncbi:MAG: DeoR/GlpR family DNA-binding transcription regulator [Qingshengfaniella sp.]